VEFALLRTRADNLERSYSIQFVLDSAEGSVMLTICFAKDLNSSLKKLRDQNRCSSPYIVRRELSVGRACRWLSCLLMKDAADILRRRVFAACHAQVPITSIMRNRGETDRRSNQI
jgi:hypothetical protein